MPRLIGILLIVLALYGLLVGSFETARSPANHVDLAQRLGFYFATEPDGFFTAEKVVPFLRDLLKHLRGNVIVVWDRGNNHKGPIIREFLKTNRRLHLEMLPPWAPDHNPMEDVWSWLKYGELVERLATAEPGASFGSIHVQTDDVDTVVRAAQIYVPRLPGGSRGTVVLPPRNGWTAVYDELCDRDPAMLRRLAQDISNRLGSFVVLVIGLEEDAVVRYILLERGRVVDEYASVPEFHGPLPPGDVVGLAANPTVVSRLTGADPARVREVARTGNVPTDLPPPAELLASLAAVLGVEGAAYGYVHAGGEPGAIPVRRPAGGPHIPPA